MSYRGAFGVPNFHNESSTYSKNYLGTEHHYRKHFGNKLDKIIVGYTGGKTKNPSYNQVGIGTTGHAEAVQVTFDPNVVSYESLVDFFFRMHGMCSFNLLDLVLIVSSLRSHNS